MSNLARVSTAVVLITAAMFPAVLYGARKNFVYTNNNNYFAANTVSAYLVKANGGVEELKGSPFSTGGEGNGGNGYIPAVRIGVCQKFLFASNDYSGNISGFAINPLTGHLKVVPGSPFTIDGTDSDGIPLAITTDCKYVFAGDLNSNLIFAFHVSANGKLVPVKGSPFSVPDQPGVLKLSPHDRFLAVTFNNLQAVGMYSVGSQGALTAVAGSPFSASPDSEGLGATDINCGIRFLYLPESVDKIDVFSIASNGALTLTSGSPFISPSRNNVAVLSPNSRFLFTSNEAAGVNSFRVLSGGNIENVPGSPFDAGLSSSGGVSINNAGTLLFVSDFGGISTQFSVMKVGLKGLLTLAPGSPTSTGQDGGMFSLAAYPAKTCAVQ